MDTIFFTVLGNVTCNDWLIVISPSWLFWSVLLPHHDTLPCIVCLLGLRLTQTWNCGSSPGSPPTAFSGRGRGIPAWPLLLLRPLTHQTPQTASSSIPNRPRAPPAPSRRLTSAASTATRSRMRIIQRWSSGWWWRRAAPRSCWSSRRANCSWPILRWMNGALLLILVLRLDLIV